MIIAFYHLVDLPLLDLKPTFLSESLEIAYLATAPARQDLGFIQWRCNMLRTGIIKRLNYLIRITMLAIQRLWRIHETI
jgi:hypothetical protein